VGRLRIHNREEAIAAYISHLGGGVPRGYRVEATRIAEVGFATFEDGWLWDVELTNGEPHIGGMSTIVGPDGKIWTFSSHPASHDPGIVELALFELYTEGVADLVDPGALADQLEVISNQKNDAIRALSDAARRGDLRRSPQSKPWPE
jgi:hypothetical protein